MINNWTEICAKCMEGKIEPHHCEYYGEPNGCNSPTYGEHPPTPSAVAMRSCLMNILAEMIDLGGIERGRKVRFSPDAIAEEIRQALAVPPRNCDVGSAEEQEKRFHDFCRARHLPRMEDSSYCAYKCPLEGGTCCELQWAQMPYEPEEGGDR